MKTNFPPRETCMRRAALRTNNTHSWVTNIEALSTQGRVQRVGQTQGARARRVLVWMARLAREGGLGGQAKKRKQGCKAKACLEPKWPHATQGVRHACHGHMSLHWKRAIIGVLLRFPPLHGLSHVTLCEELYRVTIREGDLGHHVSPFF